MNRKSLARLVIYLIISIWFWSCYSCKFPVNYRKNKIPKDRFACDCRSVLVADSLLLNQLIKSSGDTALYYYCPINQKINLNQYWTPNQNMTTFKFFQLKGDSLILLNRETVYEALYSSLLSEEEKDNLIRKLKLVEQADNRFRGIF